MADATNSANMWHKKQKAIDFALKFFDEKNRGTNEERMQELDDFTALLHEKPPQTSYEASMKSWDDKMDAFMVAWGKKHVQTGPRRSKRCRTARDGT